jgi:hypothetical protein
MTDRKEVSAWRELHDVMMSDKPRVAIHPELGVMISKLDLDGILADRIRTLKAAGRPAESEKFFTWWRSDAERAKCNLEQAIGAYCSTFPGRLHALLVELLEPMQ